MRWWSRRCAPSRAESPLATYDRWVQLHLVRLVPAPLDAVWGALTDPAAIAEWWGPEGFACPNVEWDPQAGNPYRIAMQPPEGELFHLVGEFREVTPPRRLVFSFVWEPPAPDDRETTAALSLEERGEGTEVQLHQGWFATEERRALHEGGWTDSLDHLEALLRRRREN
jgi:uncharacterized protein YndB with AHSA1/START domain